MTHTLFVSDLHLSEATPAIEAGFVALLAREQNVEAVYLLGDIFEAWIGDDDDAPLAQRLQVSLQELTERGAKLYLQRGNRDFLLGEAFANSVGAELLGDRAVIDLYGTPTLLMHGDLLCTDDTDYLAFRRMVHDPQWQADVMQKPLEERRAMARQLRAMSVDAASNKPEDIMDVNPAAVLAELNAAGAQRLIHGHTHRPARHPVPGASAGAERIVLGDWCERAGWCLRAAPESLDLTQFALD